MSRAYRLHHVVNTRRGWHRYYADRFNRTSHPDAAVLAMWHQFLYLAFGERKVKG